MRMEPLTTTDGLPNVLLVGDMSRALRISARQFAQSQRIGVCDWPPLPTVDRRLRFSRYVLEWFLEQRQPGWHEYRDQYRKQRTLLRRWKIKWFELAPPYTEPFVGAARDGEDALLSLADVATVLRTTEPTLRRAAARPGFQLPPARRRPLRWTKEQLERFLGPPSGHLSVGSIAQRSR
jgi:hypothetical protein